MSEDKFNLKHNFSQRNYYSNIYFLGRLQDARKYILNQDEKIQEHRVIRNLLAMCYLYLSEYEIAKDMFEALLAKIIQMYMHYVTIHCYFTIRMKKISTTSILKY